LLSMRVPGEPGNIAPAASFASISAMVVPVSGENTTPCDAISVPLAPTPLWR
jgi:hypothetical protein